jgi:hypothetical protein
MKQTEQVVNYITKRKYIMLRNVVVRQLNGRSRYSGRKLWAKMTLGNISYSANVSKFKKKNILNFVITKKPPTYFVRKYKCHHTLCHSFVSWLYNLEYKGRGLDAVVRTFLGYKNGYFC